MLFLRKIALSVVAMAAGYAIKKAMAKMQDQLEQAQKQADEKVAAQDMKSLKTLKEDPKTGVYYAEE